MSLFSLAETDDKTQPIVIEISPLVSYNGEVRRPIFIEILPLVSYNGEVRCLECFYTTESEHWVLEHRNNWLINAQCIVLH